MAYFSKTVPLSYIAKSIYVSISLAALQHRNNNALQLDIITV